MGNECSACNKSGQYNEHEHEQILGYDNKKIHDRKKHLDRYKSQQNFSTIKELLNKDPGLYKQLSVITSHIISYRAKKFYRTI